MSTPNTEEPKAGDASTPDPNKKVEPNAISVSDSGEPAQPTLTSVWRRLSLSEIAAVFIGFLYVSGYFINSIFIRNLGITDTELLRLEYIKIGFTFTLITLGIVLLPYGAFYLTYRVRRASKLPHHHLGAIGNALNTTLCLGFPLFLAFFITKYEWEFALSTPILGLVKFRSVVIAFLVLSLTGMIIIPAFERLVATKAGDRLRLLLYRFLVEPLRYGIFIVTLYLVLRALAQIPWMGFLISNGFYYLLAGIVFVAGMTAAVLWVRHIRGIKGSWPVYGLIAFGLCSLYYLAVTSYVFGVYNFIPSNRGGRLPLTQAYIEVTGHDNLFAEERVIGGVKLRGPVYIIEDQEYTLFVASEKMETWLYDFVPIHAIRKENVQYSHIERIEGGFPRITNYPPGSINNVRSLFPPEFYQARRVFQYDYIYFDAFFLLIWLAVLMRDKQYRALIFGLIIAPIIYFIDAYIWWNSSAGPNYPPGTYIREYWIGGNQVPRPQGQYMWPKFGADFMMTISYALFTFPWLFIVFRNLRQGKLFSKEVVKYTLIWVSMWFLTPLLSALLSINDTPVEAVRYMNSQFPVWIINLFIGYGLLLVVYRNNLALVGRILGIGVLGALIMELPLYLFRIRPTGILFVIFEGFFLLNQGVPYLFLTFDKIIPAVQRKYTQFRTSNS